MDATRMAKGTNRAVMGNWDQRVGIDECGTRRTEIGGDEDVLEVGCDSKHDECPSKDRD
jgi:hypothetical protein